MMFHILRDSREDFGGKGKSKRAEKNGAKKSPFWLSSARGSPRMDVSLPLEIIVQPLPPFPQFIEQLSHPSLLPSLLG